MKCQACGREMVNRGAYFECSNFFCDYEEDIKNQGLISKQDAGAPNIVLFKSTIMTRTIAAEIHVFH